jgi:hypothetical protein
MTRCTEFYEKLERDGNFCGLPTRFFKEAMEYWLEYRKDAESNGDKSPKSEREWFNDKRNTAEVAKQRKEELSSVRNEKGQLIGRESPTTEPETCETCPNAKENVLDALSILDHYGISPEIGDMIEKWIEEKYGK